MPHTIVGIDPGQTTGFITLELTENMKDFKVTSCFEIGWEERLDVLHLALYYRENVHIVVEAFRLFPHKALAQTGSQFPSSQVIGIVEAFCWMNGIGLSNIAYQQPGDISKVAVLDRDLKDVAGSAHKIDAYRHARLYFLRHFYIDPFSGKA